MRSTCLLLCFSLYLALLAACTPAASQSSLPIDTAPASTPTQAAIPVTPTSPPPSSSPTLPPPTATALPPSPTLVPASPTPLACWQQGGQVEEKQMESIWLEKPLTYRVYTPPCYQEESERRYPVLYLIHGQTYRADQWDRLGVDETADHLIAAGEIAPLVIVMPQDDNHYTPPPENTFGEALLYDLLPAIDREYRTMIEREQRAIGGLSRGGNWAVHLGLAFPGFFSAIGAHSTPTFVTDGPAVIRGWLAQIPPDEMPRIFVDTGENDRWLDYNLAFEQILNEQGIPHEWYLYPGYHEEAYWSAHLEQYLRWYTAEW